MSTLKPPVAPTYDNPEYKQKVKHICFPEDKNLTFLNRFVAMKDIERFGELSWKDKARFWKFLSELENIDLPATEIEARRMLDKHDQLNAEQQSIFTALRQPCLQEDRGQIAKKRNRWKNQVDKSRTCTRYDVNRLIQYYLDNDLMAEEDSIFNLSITQVFAEVARLATQLASIETSIRLWKE